jgi:hypothetical protein
MAIPGFPIPPIFKLGDIEVEEIQGSPTFAFQRDGAEVTRVFKVNWDDFPVLMFALFPTAEEVAAGWPDASHYPVPYGWLYVKRVRVEPWEGQPSILGDFPANYRHARVTLEYASENNDERLVRTLGGVQGDWSGPGGSSGSLGDVNFDNPIHAFLEHKVGIGGEFITWPASSLRWGTPASGEPDAPEKEYVVGGDTHIGRTSVTIDHHITWRYVPYPPWTAIRQCVGKVNAYHFAGCPRATMLFLGLEATHLVTSPSGLTAWNLDMKFMEKNHNAFDPLTPMGWNYYLRPNGVNAGTFQEVWRKVPFITLPDGSRGAPQTTLAADVTPDDQFLEVTDASMFPKQGQFRIIVNPVYPGSLLSLVPGIFFWEEMVVTSVQGNVLNVLRGFDGDPVKSFTTGMRVIQFPGKVYDEADFAYLFQFDTPV